MIEQIICTKRILLRKLKKEDNFDLLDILSSENVGRYLTRITDIEAINKLIDKKIEKYKTNTGENFSIIERKTDKVIGNFELKINEKEENAEISYVINDKYWNKGYATESALAVIDFVFNNLNVNKIIADCLETNLSSYHILKDKLKMKKIGIEARVDKITNATLKFVCFELEK